MTQPPNDRLYADRTKQVMHDTERLIKLHDSGHSRGHELDDFFVGKYGSRTILHANVISELVDTLKQANREEDIQRFLAQHPEVLTKLLLGNHGSWCLPKPRLGSERVPDFLIAEMDSMGFRWYGIELESPTADLYTKAGERSATLTHSIRQVQQCRDWLQMNLRSARTSREEHGQSLIDIEPDLPCFVFIGRHTSTTQDNKEDRRRLEKENRIVVHHYDWLLRKARGD